MLQLLKKFLGLTTPLPPVLRTKKVGALYTSNVSTFSSSGTSLTTVGARGTPGAIIPPVECTLRDQIDFINLVLLLGKKDLLEESLAKLGDTNNYA